jgi:stage II sporulation protein R
MILTALWGIESESAVEKIGEGIVRLHILANSDSAADQALKLAVRDAVLKKFSERARRDMGENAEISREYVLENLESLREIAREEIRAQGYEYGVRIEAGKFYFPTKRYENIALPAGEYFAVRALIGAGEGQNWWCVMYPPLCFSANAKGELSAEDMEKLRKATPPESYDLIAKSGEIRIKPTFKLVELWQELTH